MATSINPVQELELSSASDVYVFVSGNSYNVQHGDNCTLYITLDHEDNVSNARGSGQDPGGTGEEEDLVMRVLRGALEKIPNGQSTTRDLDSDDCCVELGVFRGSKHIFSDELKIEVASVYRRELVDRKTDTLEKAEERYYMYRNKKPAGVPCPFLIRLLGPRARFIFTFTLSRKRRDPSETWEEVCQTSVEFENTGKRKKKKVDRGVSSDEESDEFVDKENSSGKNADCKKKMNRRRTKDKGNSNGSNVTDSTREMGPSFKGQLKPKGETRRSSMIKDKLEGLLDDGHWEEFDKLKRDLYKDFTWGKKDTLCIIKMEESKKACSMNELEKARELLETVIREACTNTDNPHLLQGRAYYLLSNVYMKERNYGLAENCLQDSEKCLAQTKSSEDLAEFYLSYGSFVKDFLTTSRSPHAKGDAKKYYYKALEVASKISEKRKRAKAKIEIQASLLIALLLLQGGSNERDLIKEAKDMLDKVEQNLWSFMTERTKVMFFFASSDLFYHQGRHALALDEAERARRISQKMQLNSLIDEAQARIDRPKR